MSETAVIDYYFDMVLTITLGIDYSWLHIPASPISAPPKLLGRGTRCRFTKVPLLDARILDLGLLSSPAVLSKVGRSGFVFPIVQLFLPSRNHQCQRKFRNWSIAHSHIIVYAQRPYGHLEDTRNVQEGGWGRGSGIPEPKLPKRRIH